MFYIPKMGAIYSYSIVTIIAASGSNADAGLPGIRPSTRHLGQPLLIFDKSFNLGNTGLMPTLDPPYSRDWEYSTGSHWSSRAWTFQERLLSKRVLVFTPEVIFWECQQATWREDCFGELPSGFPTFFTPCLGDDAFWSHHKLSTVWKSHPFDFINTYRQIASHYTKLQMSFQDDGLNAIAGILDILERRSGHTFFWGLPVAFLPGALAWESYSGDNTTVSSRNERRTGKHTFQRTQHKSECCQFPSWSWVGWTGRIWYSSNKDGVFDQSGLVFYELVGPKNPRLREGQRSVGNGPHHFWKRPGWDVNREVVITNEHIPNDMPSDITPSNILAFWSEEAYVTIIWQDVDLVWRSYHDQSKVKAEVCQGHIKVMSIWSQVPVGVKSFSSQEGSFVVIGVDSDHVNVLLVSRLHGITYRLGIAKIKESDWLQFEGRLWTPILLA
jgi:hypothetical protein